MSVNQWEHTQACANSINVNEQLCGYTQHIH